MKKKKKFLITIFIIIVILVSSFFLFKNTILQSRVFRIINDRLDFIVNTKDVKVPEDALSFSVYDIDEEKYLFNEGGK